MERENREDEINLLELFLKSLYIIRANFWLIISFFIVGTLVGLGYYYNSKKIYENSMVISSNILTKSYCQKLIERANKYRRENNLKALASQLSLSEAQAKEIILIKVDDVLEVTENKEQTALLITVRVGNQDILQDLQSGVIEYLENNEFVKIRVEQNEKFFKETIAKLDEEIKDIEKLKLKIATGDFFQSTRGNVMFDPTTVNSKILELTKEKLTLQNNLALVNSVQIVEGFTRYERPVSPNFSLSLVSGSLVGLTFVAIFIAFKSLRRLLRMADAAKQKT